MLYHVRMDVHPPLGMDPAKFDQIKAAEKDYVQELQRSGKWVHLWRIVGEYSNISIFNVADNDEMQTILPGLPLMQLEIKGLAELREGNQPSAPSGLGT